MIVIVGLVVLLAAVIVGFTGVLTNAGPDHPLTENFSVFGYHVTGSTGTCSCSGSWSARWRCWGYPCCWPARGAPRAAGATPGATSQRSQRETAFLNRDRDTTARTPAGRSHRHGGELAGGHHPPQAGFRVRSLVARTPTDGHGHVDSPR